MQLLCEAVLKLGCHKTPLVNEADGTEPSALEGRLLGLEVLCWVETLLLDVDVELPTVLLLHLA